MDGFEPLGYTADDRLTMTAYTWLPDDQSVGLFQQQNVTWDGDRMAHLDLDDPTEVATPTATARQVDL